MCRWLAEQAEALGVEIFPGFPASEILYNEDGSVKGVATQDMGIDKEGNQKDSFEPGIELLGKVTVFAEGCRGHLGKQLIEKFNLSKDKDPQQYGIGFKEIWEIEGKNHEEGMVMHTAGWPLDNSTYGGSFMYHAENKQVFLGYVIGLDYKNPYLSPYDEFQRFKTHPSIKKIIEGGKRISYGARALIEGGLQSLPQMFMPGALLVGCDAGTLNMPKIKGSHTAMKSGMIAAETIIENIKENKNLSIYEEKFKKSWVYEELHAARNVKPSFSWGLILGIIFTGIDQILSKGGVHSEFTIMREASDSFYLVSAGANQRLDHDWIQKWMPSDGTVQFENLTNSMGVLVVSGPKARELMTRVSTDDFSAENFKWLSAKNVNVGNAPVNAMRVNFVGELGWELHHPIEYQNHIFDKLMEAGKDLGLKPYGIRAMNSLRVEKSYKLVGTELSIEYSPYESGLDRFVHPNKGNFIGLEALNKWREKGFENKLVTMEIHNVEDADVLGNNPIYENDKVVGRATGGDFGFRLGKSIALGMVKPNVATTGQKLKIDILGKMYDATILDESPFDPENNLLRA